MPGSELADVSVVVVSKDEPELERTLGLLQPQCRASGAQCIVVDASQGRLDLLREMFPFVDWIDFVGPLGVRRTIAHQRNVGVRAAKGEVIAFADAGGVPAPDWLDQVTAPVREGRATSVCGRTYSLDPSPYTASPELADGAPVFRTFTNNMAFRREVFDALGGFDERFADGEDCDFGWRAEDAGFGFVHASGARMGMDWGDQTRNLRRAKLYGLADARLLSSHPKRVPEVFSDTPDLFFYPAWEVGLVATVVVALFLPWLWWVPLAWLALLSIPLLHNVGQPQPVLRVGIHLLRGVWFWIGWVALLADGGTPVAFVPRDRVNPYQELLRASLARAGVGVSYIDHGPTRSRSINMIVGPFRLCWRRVRGTRIVHLHYPYAFAHRSSRQWPLIRRLPRWLLSVWLFTARQLGIRLVYTVHDLVPHQETFDDDGLVQRGLLRHADATICLSEASRETLRTIYPPPTSHDLSVIGEGPPIEIEDSADARRSARDRAGFGQDTVAIVAAGHLEWYKGFDLVLDALSEVHPDKEVAVRLAGPCTDPDYRQVLESAAEHVRTRGIDVVLDVRVLAEEELDDLLLAGDIAAFPFRSITNSGSLRRAAARRLAILIPEIDVLRDVPAHAAMRFEPGTDSSLVSALRSLIRMSVAERSSMGDAAHAWSQVPSWEEIGARTRDVYDRVLMMRGRRQQGQPADR